MRNLIRSAALVGGLAAWVTAPPALAEDFVDMDDLMEIEELIDEDGQVRRTSAPEIADPLKGLNQAIFGFNNSVYKNVFQPFSRQYVRVVPKEARKGIWNFFNNLEYPIRLTGNLLQARFGRATQETGKFIVNTTAGFGGFMNAAQEFEELQPPREDIGQAFGRWGIDHGFYIVLPFAGPTSLRDLIGRFGGNYVDPISEPWSQVDDSKDRFVLLTVDTVNDLPEILDLYESITGSAIDSYTAMRDGYTQMRAAQVAE